MALDEFERSPFPDYDTATAVNYVVCCYSLRVVILEVIQRRDAQPTTLHILLISLSETPCQNDFLNIFLPENVPN